MDVQAKLDEIEALVEGARAMPMSASCIVNRGEMLAHLEELRALVPSEVQQARNVLRDREGVVEDGRREAEDIVEAARAEQRRMLSKTEIVQEARREAERVIDDARGDVARMRAEVDDYVDSKLANFEVVLHKTLRAVERGRSKLRGQNEIDVDGEDVEPLPG
ncbi:MAG TPA: hypothetical protein VFJ21_12550 [Mycobacteriales bacterium]|nr:hypothetical protein [Mycobacteriales bacterium]